MERICLPYDGEIEILNPGKEAVEACAALVTSSAIYAHKKKTVSSCIATFDIETSTLPNMNKRLSDPDMLAYFNTCFCWQFYMIPEDAEKGIFIFGRKPEDFFSFVKRLSAKLKDIHVICYIHNLAYEYNNLCEYFVKTQKKDDTIFFKSPIRPLFLSCRNFEFRCSAELSHLSLQKIGDDIGVSKLKGDFDYNVRRFTDTPLSTMEINYCFRDVYILAKYLQYKVKELSTIDKKKRHIFDLPYTQTGYPRRDIKRVFTKTQKGAKINREICKLSHEQYNYLHPAFWGGFVQANYHYIGTLCANILHVDLTSAYPAAMLLFTYPYHLAYVGVSEDRFLQLVHDTARAVIAEVTFKNISIKPGEIPYIPKDKCRNCVNMRTVGGKVVEADAITLTVCDVDYQLIEKAYSHFSGRPLEECLTLPGKILLGDKKPLPIAVIFSIMRYFSGKTEYKGVEGKEIEYALSKQMLNAIFGLSATSLEHFKYYVEDYETKVGEMEYTENTVIPYQWCIYITAYVRRWIYGFITRLSNKNFWIYADTDSLFLYSNAETNRLVKEHNATIHAALAEIEKTFPVSPVSPKGKKQYLGLLLNDEDTDSGLISEFCTIGAKRYFTVTEKAGKKETTVTFAGMSSTKPVKKGATYSEAVRKKYDCTPGAPGINVQRLIEKCGSLHKAFLQIRDSEVYLPYLETVDKLTAVNIRSEPGETFYFTDGVHHIEERCSYVLSGRGKHYSLTKDISNFILREEVVQFGGDF